MQGKHVLVAAATAWTENKGLNDYIQLVNLLSDDVTLILLGLADEQIKQLPSTIIGKRRTDSAHELAQYYSMADIVLNLSYQETFGLTTVEGMGCGTPGIVYNTTASPELITKDVGIVVEKGAVNMVASSIKEIIAKGKLYYTLSCRERAVSLYDKNKRYGEYIELYKNLI